MGVRNGPVDRARRRIEEDLHRARTEIGKSRRASGLSLRQLGQACGVDGSTAQRIESGAIRDPGLRVLASMAAAVGLDLRLQTYAAGDPIRDAAQQRLLDRLRRELNSSLGWRTEVILPIAADRRAWDALVLGTGWSIAVDAESVLDHLQAVERRVNMKLRDSGLARALLLGADTRRNRRALAAAPSAFAGYSREARAVLRALRRGEDPCTNAILLL